VADALGRRRLARAAALLNARGGFTGRLPALVLMTDDARLSDPLPAAAALPRGSAVVLRHRDAGERARLGPALAAIARVRSLVLLIAGDAALADRIGADGLHLSEAHAHEALHWRALRPNWLVTAAAHSERAVLAAARARAHAAFLAPVFSTESHADARALGVSRFLLMARRAQIPLYALGGIDARNAGRLSGVRAAGIAAVAALRC